MANKYFLLLTLLLAKSQRRQPAYWWSLVLLALLLPDFRAQAQGYIGLANSNYGGTNNAYVNPSSIADSRHRFYLNVIGADVNFYNTYLQLDLPERPWAKGFEFKESYLNEQLVGGPQFASISAELRLPSVMVSLGKSSIGFSMRTRSFLQASNVSENVARLARYGLAEADRLGLANRLLEDNSFNVGLNAYQEFALTYARVFTPNTEHFFKGGLTVKYEAGLGGGYILNGGTKYQVYDGDSIQLQSRDVSYGFTDYKFYDQSNMGVGTVLGSNRLGRGAGVDLGVTYEWRPDYEQYEYHMDGADHTDNTRNKYKLRVGLAITDIGAIRYNNPAYVRQAQLANTRTIQWGQLDTLSFNTLQSVGPTVQRIVGLESQSTAFTTYLPTALRLQADYRVVNHLFAGVLWTQNLLPKMTIGARSISSLALTPRVEFSHLELAVPLVLANNYQKFQVGAMARLGPLFVGSDNLGGVFGLTTSTGSDFYFGLGFALHKHKLRDRDGDQVSNKVDKCPGVKGTWEFIGCPDRDGDHVQDAVDECPDTPGLAKFKGCPDTDGDDIPDKLDACPEVAGLPAFKGCPDRDADGVQDSEDQCPDIPGVIALQGCPDKDGDGITDTDDKCPDLAGPAEHFGCPDTDGDGIFDDTDKCPTVAGPLENQGCPFADQDGDTVLDKDDKCPTVAGPVSNQGCPELDTDGDTVLDKDDQCPLTPGPVENKGCPLIAAAEQKVLNTAFSNLQFQTGKDIILKTSYTSLNELAQLLRDKPEFRLRLSGHTDNVGTPQVNLLLSRKRAEAVKRYLTKSGVPAAHIRTEYFGRTKPIATNKTAAGRAKNRRVEMKVLFD